MRVLIAPDKFKGSLTAAEVASSLANGLNSLEGLDSHQLPLADGGDGSVAAAVAAGFRSITVPTVGPTGRPVAAPIAFDGSTAVVEVANTCGISLLPSGRLDPWGSSTYGFGIAVLAAMQLKPSTIVLALGGSASTDGGLGMLRALGATFYGRDGFPLSGAAVDLRAIETLDLSRISTNDVTFVVASDVTAPLHGPEGAAHVFGPQKGADPAAVHMLDAGLQRLAAVADPGTLATRPGAGSAGGLGFAALLLGGRLTSGAEYFLDLLEFDRHVTDADAVVTGEGRIDDQTLQGKLPQIVAMRSVPRPVHVAVGVNALTAHSPGDFARIHAMSDYTSTDTRTDPVVTARTLTLIGRHIGDDLIGRSCHRR